MIDFQTFYFLSEAIKNLDNKYFKLLKTGSPEDAESIIDDMAEKGGYKITAYHGSPTGKSIKVFSRELLGTLTKAKSATRAFFFAGNIGTSVEYATLDLSEAPFGDWFWTPKNANDLLGMIRDKMLGFSVSGNSISPNAKLMNKDLWTDYGIFIKKFINAKTPEERMEIYNTFVNDIHNKAYEYYESAREVIYNDKEWYNEIISYVYDEKEEGKEWASLTPKEKNEFIEAHYDEISQLIDEEIEESRAFIVLRLKTIDNINLFKWNKEPKDEDILKVRLKINNPLMKDYIEAYRDEKFIKIIRQAEKKGHDAVIFTNVKDGGGFDTIYAVFSPSQIKLADVETRDDDGNIIPPSKRFNSAIEDIRY